MCAFEIRVNYYKMTVCKILLFGLILKMTQSIEVSHINCTEFYIILQEETDPDDFKEIKPITLNSALDFKWFNFTDEYKTLHKNKNCVIEPSCDLSKAMSSCNNKPRVSRIMGTHTVISTTRRPIRYLGFPNSPYESTENPKNNTIASGIPDELANDTITIKPTNESETTLPKLTTTPELTTKPELTMEPELTTAPELTTKLELITEPELTTKPELTTPSESTKDLNTTEQPTTMEPTTNATQAKGLTNENGETDKPYVMIAVVAASTVGGGAVLAFTVSKILNALKYGSYRIPDTNLADTAL